MSYCEKKIKDFLEKTSSIESMPGGGVVSALVAAEGASLALKVCNLSLGKEKYKEYEQLIKESITKLTLLRETFYKLMDKDAANFKAMEEVYKMPRGTEEEKEKRKAALKSACAICCNTPLEIITFSLELARISMALNGKSNATAASDLKIASMFAEAAIRAAWENVEINVKYADDEALKKQIEPIKMQMDLLLQKSVGGNYGK
ncbi:MAG: cyclodeaminase/cyclohydrolase family protein [Lachnospiraceae bacterium]|nr:cyclodeaminase/cyclohydrolase family protein [Lachnospiraceae bacterium]